MRIQQSKPNVSLNENTSPYGRGGGKKMNIKLRELKKKILSFALIACMVGSFSLVGTADVHAAGTNPTQAETMQFGKDYYGGFYLGSRGGSHYYKFTTDNVSGINYTMRATFTESGDEDWFDVYLLDDNYNYVDQYGKATNWCCDYIYLTNWGDAKGVTFKNLKPNKTYYVKVEHWDSIYSGADKYAVCVKKSVVKPGKPVVKSCKAGKRKLTFSYYKTKYAKRYQVQMKVKGGNWKIYNNGTKLSKTIKSLKKGKKYTVRVRAQRYVNGKWYSGAWSKTRTVTVR